MDDATADPHNSLLPGAAEKPSLLLFCFVFIVELLPFMFGYSIGFTSPTFVGDCAGGANAQAMNCELLLSSEQSSLFGSVINMGALIGALTGSFVIDPLGRKAGMLTSSALFAVSWACIAAAPVPKAGATEASAALLVLLFVGRALSGVAIGFTCCVVNIYVSEVSTVSLRGALGTLFQVSIVLGLVITYLLGLFLTWREMAIIIAVMGAIVTVLLTFIPESPVWSWQRGRKETAAQDLRMLRAPDTPVDQILDAVDSQDSESEETLQGSVLQELCKPSARRPLIAGVGLAVVQQLSGINAVMFYCGKILGSVFDKATADTAAVGIQVLQLVMTGVTIPLMDRAGRRPLLFTAGVGMVVCSGALGLYYHLAGSSSALPDFFAALMLYGYVFAFAIGLGSIPWMIIGEIFPPEVKGVCGSITTAVNWSLSFMVTKTLDNMKDAVGFTGVFWIYGGCLLVGLVFIYFYVPETKGKSLAEIQAAFEARGRQYLPVPQTPPDQQRSLPSDF